MDISTAWPKSRIHTWIYPWIYPWISISTATLGIPLSLRSLTLTLIRGNSYDSHYLSVISESIKWQCNKFSAPSNMITLVQNVMTQARFELQKNSSLCLSFEPSATTIKRSVLDCIQITKNTQIYRNITTTIFHAPAPY